MPVKSLTIVVAVSLNHVIGDQQKLPWKLRSDLQRFKKLTMGHSLIMGRKTFESIGRPLPGRISIVMTRNSRLLSQELPTDSMLGEVNRDENTSFAPTEQIHKTSSVGGLPSEVPIPVIFAESIPQAIAKIPTGQTGFVIGGAQIFREALPFCNRILLTRVLAEVPGDTTWELSNPAEWKCVSVEHIPAGPSDQFPTEFQTWLR